MLPCLPYPAEVESVILKMNNVKDVVVYGKKNPIMGTVVAAEVHLIHHEEPGLFKQKLRLFCRKFLADYKVPAVTFIASKEKKTYNSRLKKIRS